MAQAASEYLNQPLRSEAEGLAECRQQRDMRRLRIEFNKHPIAGAELAYEIIRDRAHEIIELANLMDADTRDALIDLADDMILRADQTVDEAVRATRPDEIDTLKYLGVIDG